MGSTNYVAMVRLLIESVAKCHKKTFLSRPWAHIVIGKKTFAMLMLTLARAANITRRHDLIELVVDLRGVVVSQHIHCRCCTTRCFVMAYSLESNPSVWRQHFLAM